MTRSIRLPLPSGTLFVFDGVEVMELIQEPTPPIPLFRHATRMHEDRVAVIFLLEGEVQVTHEGAGLRFIEGSAASFATGTQTTVAAPMHCRSLVVSVKRNRLRRAGIEVTSTFGAFAQAAARTSPLLTFATALIEVARDHEVPAEPVATILTDLVCGLFRADEAFTTHDLGAGLGLEFDGYHETVRQFLLDQIVERPGGSVTPSP